MSAPAVMGVRRGTYADSVVLMRISRAIAGMDGIEDAALMMGTPANLDIMAAAGLLPAEAEPATSGDLVIAIRGVDQAACDAALAEAESCLERPSGTGDQGTSWRPRTIRAAVNALPDASLALISVPGDFAAAEARKALGLNLHVMLFSDNVSLEDEISLKTEARRRGLLMMGPDCGTAILGGAALGFANRVPRGNIGIIGASGTGIQEISCLLARNGGGVSHAIGVGGRDLTEAVGGIMTGAALELLEADPATPHMVLVSKPPAPAVVAMILERIRASKKTFTVCFLGADHLDLPPNVSAATTLRAAAQLALGGGTLIGDRPAITTVHRGHLVLGLFTGGTLAAEARIIFRADSAHRMVDFGDDAYTKGRPHPMIDPMARDEALRDAIADPVVGVVLLDVVIGLGAHADPAGHVAGLLAEIWDQKAPRIIASVTGTDQDPQDRSAQIAKLQAAGVLVAPSNADAADLALACLKP